MLPNYVLNAQKRDFVQILKNAPGLSNVRQTFFQNEVEILFSLVKCWMADVRLFKCCMLKP